MKNTIREIWYGNIAPIEYCGTNDKEIGASLRLMEKLRLALTAELSEKQFELVQKYIDISDEYAFQNATVAFTEGFSLAVKLMGEAFLCK